MHHAIAARNTPLRKLRATSIMPHPKPARPLKNPPVHVQRMGRDETRDAERAAIVRSY
jgi:hypothetical protein